MFRFVCKTILHSRNGYSSVTPHNPSSVVVSLSLIRRYLSIDADNAHSFTVSYLTQTCGLSPKSALLASKNVRFESSEQPDSVLSCFQKYGFSKSHISEMIAKFPKLLHCDPDKTISPKVEFYRSKGVSTPEIARIFSVNPLVLKSSLENTLVYSYNILRELFQSDNKVVELMKRNPYLLYRTPEECLLPNINTLRDNRVPASNILWLIRKHWLCILRNPVKFEKVVEEVKEMGFSPLKLQFVKAIMVLTISTKSKWDGRVEVYKRYGWSDKDVTKAFKKEPLCMAYSEDNITGTMDFYVNKLGLESSILVNCPVLIGFSLKKRLIPRGAVIQYLSSKGLITLDSSISKLDSKMSSMFICTEKCFLKKYVTCHEEAPHLIELYNKKLNLSDTRESGEDEE